MLACELESGQCTGTVDMNSFVIGIGLVINSKFLGHGHQGISEGVGACAERQLKCVLFQDLILGSYFGLNTHISLYTLCISSY